MTKRRMMKLVLVVVMIASFVAAGALLLGNSPDEPAFRTEKITRGDIAQVVSATGTLSPGQVVTVGGQVSGQVNKLHVQLNEQGKAGQLLPEIDPTLLLTQLKQDGTALETARSNYEQAGRDLARVRQLLTKEFVAKVDLEHAQQAYRAAENGYDAAKTVVERDEANLNYAKIVAPIDGVIISKDVDLGQTLAAGLQAPSLFRSRRT
jgi:HlyD family secretion protein